MLIGAWYTWLCYANRSLALLCSSILVYLAPNVDRRWPSWRAWLCYANRITESYANRITESLAHAPPKLRLPWISAT